MTRRRVLFVDDEPQILDGLRNLLRRHRKQWDMVFVDSGEAALGELERARFDAVITDMRMPGMDGATLLGHVRDRQPATARIILSGYAEREALIRAIPIAHQMLCKPCDEGMLRTVVERSVSLSELLHHEDLRALVGGLSCLPSTPQVFSMLTQACERPSVTMNELTAIVETDPAIALRVMQIANSAMFGPRGPTNSIAQAISQLGIDLLRSLVMTAHVFAEAEQVNAGSFSAVALQRHSLAVARVARRLAPNRTVADRAFAAGLLHEIGALTMAGAGLTERLLDDATASVREPPGATHAEVGAYVLAIWGLPNTVIEAVAFHHRPEMIARGLDDVSLLVHIADALVTPLFIDGVVAPSVMNEELIDELGLLDRLVEWREIAAEEEALALDGTSIQLQSTKGIS